MVLRQVSDTLKFALVLADAMNAPASALSSRPNSTLISSGASGIPRSFAMIDVAAGWIPADRLLEGVLGLLREPVTVQSAGDATVRGIRHLDQDASAVLQRKLDKSAGHATTFPTPTGRRGSDKSKPGESVPLLRVGPLARGNPRALIRTVSPSASSSNATVPSPLTEDRAVTTDCDR